MTVQLQLLPGVGTGPTRTQRDRLEVLTALIAAPSFDPLFRTDVIAVPGDHPTYRWMCGVADCERAQNPGNDLCKEHNQQWAEVMRDGGTRADFVRAAVPLRVKAWHTAPSCLICPDNPATGRTRLCLSHQNLWNTRRRAGDDFDLWLSRQRPYPAFGSCRVLPCCEPAYHPLGLCSRHLSRYRHDGKPGGAQAAGRWMADQSQDGLMVVTYEDRARFDRWCRETGVVNRMNGKLSLVGLKPLVKAEIQWSLFAHTQGPAGAIWALAWVQYLIDHCRRQQADSLVDLDLDACSMHPRKIAKAMLKHLRLVYFTREDSKDVGFIETDHFGVRFTDREKRIDLVDVSQRWLRDLLWDYIARRLTVDPPRSRNPIDVARRGCIELSAYLEAQAPAGGHEPALLTAEAMTGFVADQRRRAEHNLRSLAPVATGHGDRRRDTNVTKGTMARAFNGARRVLREALDAGATETLGLHRAFVVTLPYGKVPTRRRRPFNDRVAKALATEANLADLERRDPNDRGMRDAWEALVLTGRRCREVLEVRLECIGRHGDLPMFWHDQTKVGNLDEGIRIPERLYQRLEHRQAKTIALFVQRNGRPPTAEERLKLALFPRRHANRNMLKGLTYSWFHRYFREWIIGLDIGRAVPHQARHTLATNLLKAGANLSHVKRYLGQVSEQMAEHYVHLANTDPRLEQALTALWVAGPGAAEPGLVLSGTEPMTRAEAEALAIDLTRRSTPAEGGFCTFQPVVNGDACPWNLNCHNCDKFVLSGADLVYWHRKREQWRMLAERAPDPATADFLHEVFEPTARAIDGLEKALAAVGLLDEALALDLRRPQDYFGRVWNTAF
ncbi:tyrosine-type recombinase/integrase [Kitasatospora sp. NPDC058406]|uniref:tyrosine-type recombinase/integrase n=1 Tax=Kitasatospora sp. NPDC058406 TaxID=3346483 RepID=UPI003647AE58